MLVALIQKTYDATLPGWWDHLVALPDEPWWRPLAWLGYPAAFLAFLWVRGSIDGWYVYDFLDPTLDGGWPAMLVVIAQVLVAFLVVAILVHFAGNRRAALAAGPSRR